MKKEEAATMAANSDFCTTKLQNYSHLPKRKSDYLFAPQIVPFNSAFEQLTLIFRALMQMSSEARDIFINAIGITAGELTSITCRLCKKLEEIDKITQHGEDIFIVRRWLRENGHMDLYNETMQN